MEVLETKCSICNNIAILIASGNGVDYKHQEVDWATFMCKTCGYTWSEA